MLFNPLTQTVDKFMLAGKPSPGIAEIVGAGSPRKWNEIGGLGWSGGVLVFAGIKLSHFTARLTLVDDTDWEDWEAFKPIVLRGPSGKRPRALPIVHPVLATVGIHACVVDDVRAPVQSGDGIWTIEIPMIESRLPKKGKAVRPKGADAAEQEDPREREIARLTAVRDRLAQEGNAQ